MLNAHNINLPEKLEYNGVVLEVAELDQEQRNRVVEYLLTYGFNKTLQDSVAGRKKELVAEGLEEDEIAETLRNEMLERVEAIVNGTLGARGPRGPRLETEARIRRDVINEFFKAFLVRKGQTLPKVGKDATETERKALADKIAAFKQRYADANEAKISEEVARRVAAQKAPEDEFELDLDFSDL